MSNMFNPRLLNIPVLNVTRTGTHQYSLRIWLAARKNELAAMVKGLIKSNLTDIGVASKKILPQYPPPPSPEESLAKEPSLESVESFKEEEIFQQGEPI